MNMLIEFIESEEKQFTREDGSKFANSLFQIQRYYSFLIIIYTRHKSASEELIATVKALQAIAQPGERSIGEALWELFEKQKEINNRLHLEIESFYLFAKILLDKAARSLEFCFGPLRGKSLDSHDQFVKRFKDYAETKNLKMPDVFLKIIESLKINISDFRDYKIAHAKNPREMLGTAWDGQGRTSIISTNLSPKESDKQWPSKELAILLDEVDAYIEILIELLKTNRDKTVFQRVSTV